MRQRIKPYKEELPSITINKIRSILNELGIFVTEIHKQNGDFYFCRIEIANDGLRDFHIGTNGKGTSLEYAYASAYAEFMERLQNNVLIENTFFFSNYFNKSTTFNQQLKKENKKIDFIYSPNEKLIKVSTIVNDNFNILSKLFSINNIKELQEFIKLLLNNDLSLCVPFYNKNQNKINYLPIDILLQSTGSTGMCAGNSPEEALVQGISEILERYSIIEIYSKRITPPTVPHEYFKEYSVFKLIKGIEEKGYSVIIKDFSLNKNLPVIGVIVIDQKSRHYNVKVGSDPWPITALERCLTELYQSFDGIRLNKKSDYGTFLGNKYDGINKIEANYINLSNILNNATGSWPDSIFSDNFSYNFNGFNFNLGVSNKIDLKYLIDLIENLGYNIYIRDVSFLGLNAYYVIIPGLSQDKRNKSEYFIFSKLNNSIGHINNITTLSKSKLKLIVSILEKKYLLLKNNKQLFERIFLYNTDNDAIDLTIDLFLSMANYKIGNINKTYHYLDTYLKDKDVSKHIYYYACKDYFLLKINKKNKKEIYSYMNKIYGKALTEEIIEDLQDPNTIFKEYDLKFYFECINCDIKSFKYYSIASILKNIETKHKSNIM